MEDTRQRHGDTVDPRHIRTFAYILNRKIRLRIYASNAALSIRADTSIYRYEARNGLHFDRDSLWNNPDPISHLEKKLRHYKVCFTHKYAAIAFFTPE